jgi:tetratricopeptide (TPR) repeat protein/transcriptional regulator with XRE-family HTH domain
LERFSELLDQYIRRLGLSDAELARAVGVRRQTIFRWREGLTARPRYREDVLGLADKLRLTLEERDTLLIAAGFQPETPPVLAPAGQPETDAAAGPATGPDDAAASAETEVEKRSRLVWARPGIWLGGVLMLVLGMSGMMIWFRADRPDDGREVTSVAQTLTAEASESAAPTIVPASPGEIVVLVTHFANYAGSEVGYNVAGRLADALNREIRMLQLTGIRVAVVPEAVGESDRALNLGTSVGAALVIFGEYDLGRIVVRFAHPRVSRETAQTAVQREVADLQELSAVINTDLSQQVRPLALLALGQLYLDQGDVAQARSLLSQAGDDLAGDAAVDQKTVALAQFYLGIAYQQSHPPQLEAAIAAYTQALTAWPEMISSRMNRSTTYQTRQQAGDLQLALDDVDRVIAAVPDWAVAYNNRASIRIRLGGPDNETLALVDLDQALELDPVMAEAYFNRAIVHFEQGQPTETWAADLQAALALRPNHAETLNQLCRNYALDQLPEAALPYCDRLIALDPQPLYRDSRGLAYALAGDYPAAMADFQAFIDWLASQPDPTAQTTLAQRQRWVEALQAGENPLTPAVLGELR